MRVSFESDVKAYFFSMILSNFTPLSFVRDWAMWAMYMDILRQPFTHSFQSAEAEIPQESDQEQSSNHNSSDETRRRFYSTRRCILDIRT
jgi:hypothetical protein